MVWLACQPTEGSKHRPAGLGWTLQQAISHTPKQLEFVLATEAEIKGLTRNLAIDSDRADGKTPEMSREEMQAYWRRKREIFTGNSDSPIAK